MEIEVGENKFRITYHPTELVNFHGTHRHRIYCEPLHKISQLTFLALISVPQIQRLQTVDRLTDTDSVIELPPGFAERVNFGIYAAPISHEPDGRPLFKIPYDKCGFCIVVKLEDNFQLDTVPVELRDRFIKVTPANGTMPRQMLSKSQAVMNGAKIRRI